MGELLGVARQARKIAGYAYDAGVTDAKELVVSVAVCLSESQGYDRAYNDNVVNGVVKSRDVGLWQINIDADQIGTSVEENLYDVHNNAEAMFAKYAERGWQPWVAFNTKTYLHDTYVQRASLGVMNFLAEMLHNRAVAAGQSPATPVPMVSLKQLQKLLA